MHVCKWCKYCVTDPVDKGLICVNYKSEFCADWVEEDTMCEHWEEGDKENGQARRGR